MTEHYLEADITDGKVDALRVSDSHPETELHWNIQDLRIGKWECSCGETFSTEREAAQHLNDIEDTEVNRNGGDSA